MKYASLFYFLVAFLVIGACKKTVVSNKDKVPYPIQRVSEAKNAMVVSAHPLASDIGVYIMKQGGNAVDAAIAVQFALAVVYPRAGNIGGGGFMVIRVQDGKAFALDYREMAPAAAYRDMYLDSLSNVIDGLSVLGHLASGVPGTVHGMYSAWEKLGAVDKFSTLLEPAIKLANEGFHINASEAGRLNQYQDDFRKFHNTNSPFVKENWKSNDLIQQEDLAKTLTRIAQAENADGFYTGKTAELFVEEMDRGNGIITLEDLKNYQSKWRIPQIGYYKNDKIISMPPPSSGGIALIQLLEIIEQYNVDTMGFQSLDYIHLVAEACRRVYADRAEFLGDEDFIDVPAERLLDSIYLRERMNDFQKYHATKSSSVGSGDIDIKLESFETTHTSVVDSDGMAVSVTTTLNLNYGSKVLVNGAGFFLNNEMDDFSAKPGVANFFGLIGNEANAIAPQKRMLSSMTPTIIEQDGKAKLVLGTPGGSTIITSVFQVIMNVLEFDMTLDEAVYAPRFHHQWLPDKIMTEKDMWNKALTDSLQNRGHELGSYDRIGLVKAIEITTDGKLIGVGDHRSDDHASGY